MDNHTDAPIPQVDIQRETIDYNGIFLRKVKTPMSLKHGKQKVIIDKYYPTLRSYDQVIKITIPTRQYLALIKNHNIHVTLGQYNQSLTHTTEFRRKFINIKEYLENPPAVVSKASEVVLKCTVSEYCNLINGYNINSGYYVQYGNLLSNLLHFDSFPYSMVSE